MTQSKKDRLLGMAQWIKGVTGTIGMSALISDHKWVGIAVLVIGAMANEYIRVMTSKHV